MSFISDFNAGVDAAAKVMDDLDRGGWFAEAIRVRAMLAAPTEADDDPAPRRRDSPRQKMVG